MSFLILGLGLFTQCGNGNLQTARSIIASVDQELAPDHRVCIYALTAQKKGGEIVIEGETSLPNVVPTLQEHLTSAGVKAILNITVLPDGELREKPFGIVNISVTNLRSSPTRSAELVTQAIFGTPVQRYKTNGHWDLIQTPDGYLGWVDQGTLTLLDSSAFHNWRTAPRCIYTAPYGLIFTSPDPTQGTISDIVIGSILETTSRNSRYWSVRLPDGREGMLPADKVVDFSIWARSSKPKPESIVRQARTFMGFPYLWGGTSAKGFDCSGFTKTVYLMDGLLLPRDASQQVRVGELVTRKMDFTVLQPGDLMFFGRRATDGKPEKATHVGIYIGDTEFIHSAGKVKINSLDSTRTNYNEYRYKHFLQARRVIADTTISRLDRMDLYFSTDVKNANHE